WTRAEWCREIIRSALRYYVGDGQVPDPGEARGAVRATAAEPVSPQQSRTAADSPAPAVSASGPALPPGSEPAPATPESPARSACPHPAEARDYETGTCAACGAILWD